MTGQRYRALLIAVIATLALLLTACDLGAPNASGQTTPDEDATTRAESPGEEAADDEHTESQMAADVERPEADADSATAETDATPSVDNGCSGVAVTAGTNLVRLIDRHSAGTTFCLANGTYVVGAPLKPKARQRFVAVDSREAVLTGRDRTAMAFDGQLVDYVELHGLVIENFATPASDGLAAVRTGPDWLLVDNEIRNNARTGVDHRDGTRLVGNHIHHNGLVGITGYQSSNVVIEDNEVSYNNTSRSDNMDGGGGKWVGTRNITVRNNHVHHNWGSGIWFDFDNVDIEITNNRTVNNFGKGIQYEASCAGVIKGNTSSSNSHSGLELVASRNVDVARNTMASNDYGIRVWHQDRGLGRNCRLTLNNVRIHDNDISMSEGYTGLQHYMVSNGDSIYAPDDDRVLFYRNSYSISGDGRRFHFADNTRTAKEWRDYGNDRDGTFTHD